jgi:Flp pilus assembly protein TadB
VSAANVAAILAAAAVIAAAISVRGARAPCTILLGIANDTAPRPSDADAATTHPLGSSRGAAHRDAAHAAAVDREVPEMLDLLAAGSSGGLSAELALRRASAALPGILGRDLRAIFARADLGARWRDELDAYAVATASSDLRRAIAILGRSETLGSSLLEATRDLASDVRRTRRAAALERARTAPVKMLFPLVFLILPAFLLLTVVPVLLATIHAIG